MSNQRFFRVPFAETGDKTPIPDVIDAGGAISYPQGFGPDYERPPVSDPLAKRVPRPQTNQYLYDITQNLRQYQLMGTPEWVTAAQNGGVSVPYALGARVLYDAGGGFLVYRSLVNSNVALPTVTANWRVDMPYLLATIAQARAGVSTDTIVPPSILAQAVQEGAWRYAVATGTNTLVAAFTPAITAYVTGMVLRVQIPNTNTGAVTLDAGAGAQPVQTQRGAALKAGDLTAGAIMTLVKGAASWFLAGLSLSDVGGRLLGTQTFNTAGTFTYTPTPGTAFVIATVVGGGGAGGGSGITGAGACAAGAGGAYGASGQGLYTSAFAGVTVTVGAGGVGIAGIGPSGGASSFGALLSAPGGPGGEFIAPTTGVSVAACPGGSPPTGWNIWRNAPQVGTPGVSLGGGTGYGGIGGSGAYGAGANGRLSTANGSPAVDSHGGGGGGAFSAPSNAVNRLGGNGATGIVIVQEFS